MKNICGLDCSECGMIQNCKGCYETGGHPFGGDCVIALCCKSRGCENHGKSFEKPCLLKKKLADEFNALGIVDMERVERLNALEGAYVNLEYKLHSGQTARLLDDTKVYLGNQLRKFNSDRYYGIVADESFLLVCEYGENGSDPEIVVYQKRR